MKNHIVKIIAVEPVTHDVKRFIVKKPKGYKFTPGQATEISINNPALKNEKRPFTFTSLNNNEYLEFTIKIYDRHSGVTKELGKLKHGDELIIRDAWGAIEYKGEGVFIAGGAGVTPFIAILRQLHAENKIANNKLICTNKTESDIILKKELDEIEKSAAAEIESAVEFAEKSPYPSIDTIYNKIRGLNPFPAACNFIGMWPMRYSDWSGVAWDKGDLGNTA